MFGYEQGAFTGANHSRNGKVDQAQNGTLFLDEIGDLDATVQAKLLQVLQDFRFSRLGGTEERAVDIWLICATHRNLQADIEAGPFPVGPVLSHQRSLDRIAGRCGTIAPMFPCC